MRKEKKYTFPSKEFIDEFVRLNKAYNDMREIHTKVFYEKVRSVSNKDSEVKSENETRFKYKRRP